MTGPLVPYAVTADDVCGAVLETLQAHLPGTLAVLATASGLDLPVPASYDMPSPQSLRSGESLPALVVSTPGTAGQPSRDGDGSYRAGWQIVCTVFARSESGTYEDTARAVRLYVAAVRTTLLAHGDLDGLASDTVWTGEDYAAVDASKGRTLGGGYCYITVSVDDVARTSGAGVGEPPDIQAVELDITVHPGLD